MIIVSIADCSSGGKKRDQRQRKYISNVLKECTINIEVTVNINILKCIFR